MIATPWTLIGRLIEAVRSGDGLPLPLAVQLQTDPTPLRTEWHAPDLTTIQLACVLLLWVDPEEFVRRMKIAAEMLDGERVLDREWRNYPSDLYGTERIEFMTMWQWKKLSPKSPEKFRKMIRRLSIDARRRFFLDAETTARVSVVGMLGRTDQPDEIGMEVRDILLGNDPPSVREIVAAASRWRA